MRVLIYNSSPRPIKIDGVTLTAGAQQSFEKSVVPKGYHKYIDGEDAEKAVEAEQSEDKLSPIEKLQLGTVKTIQAALPHLNIDKLKELHALEERSVDPRSSALAAISAELLSRSSDNSNDEKNDPEDSDNESEDN